MRLALVLVSLVLSSFLARTAHAQLMACGDDFAEGAVLALADGQVTDDFVAGDDHDAELGVDRTRPKQRIYGSAERGYWCASLRHTSVNGKLRPTLISGAGLRGEAGAALDAVTLEAWPVSNAELRRRRKAGTLVTPPSVEGGELPASLRDPASFRWAERGDVILVGSAPGELYQGKAARRAFARWKLALRFDGAVRWGRLEGELVWLVANLVATPARGASTTYRVLLVLHAGELVLAHFALPGAR